MLLQELIESQPSLKKMLNGMPKEIQDRCVLKRMKKGSTVIGKGDEIKYVDILCQGELDVINEFANGSIYVFDTNKAIDFIGEMEALADETRAIVTNRARTDCMVLRVPIKDFIAWTEKDSYITMIIAKRLANRLCYTSGYQGYSNYFPAAHMIKRFIMEYVNREMDTGQVVNIKMKRQEIADILGLSVKTVGRNVTKLKEQGLVSVRKGKIYVNRDQLMHLKDTMEVW
ncbi:Crp/Fnr family transcriptional regulator [Vallitalea pronyensis]|uniref:Crp/Fnr family transcriptional regulator n=1 Tax=Vallitalea pronyensis TaxID=1348613 RepID=A0A8J8SJ24_9FIRM|nr:Crp/Fnr family transcriptional regulator [Vallitalea pronyensis]QUI25047.1 Crp/Fnr family transcriptional regulator [Vallitalea pronyensis]